MIRRLYEILEPPREGDSASRNFDLVILALILLSIGAWMNMFT